MINWLSRPHPSLIISKSLGFRVQYFPKLSRLRTPVLEILFWRSRAVDLNHGGISITQRALKILMARLPPRSTGGNLWGEALGFDILSKLPLQFWWPGKSRHHGEPHVQPSCLWKPFVQLKHIKGPNISIQFCLDKMWPVKNISLHSLAARGGPVLTNEM